jgi:hypothetical protein
MKVKPVTPTTSHNKQKPPTQTPKGKTKEPTKGKTFEELLRE